MEGLKGYMFYITLSLLHHLYWSDNNWWLFWNYVLVIYRVMFINEVNQYNKFVNLVTKEEQNQINHYLFQCSDLS